MMTTLRLKREISPVFSKERWLELLDRRLVPAALYFASEWVLCLLLALWSGEAAFSLYWTFWQGESSYIWWHKFFGLHPLRGYLFIVLATATVRLSAMWLIFFKGNGPLLDLPAVRRIFNPTHYPRLYAVAEYAVTEKKNRIFLFSVALIPGIWWLGFLALRQNAMKWGVATVLLGNIIKLTTFSLVFSLGLSRSVAYVVIAAVVVAAFTPRLVERLLPGNGPHRTLRSLQ